MTAGPNPAPGGGAPGRSSRWARSDPLDVLVYVLIFVTAVSQMAIVPLLPEVAHRYSLGASSLAWVLTLPGIAMLVSSAPIGMLGDRLGNRRVTLAGAVLLSFGVLAEAVTSLPVLVLARLVYGVGYGTLWTTGLAWLAERSPAGAPRRLGMTVTASAIGSTVGPTFAGVLADRFGFPVPFLVAGGLTAVVTTSLVVGVERSQQLEAVVDRLRVGAAQPAGAGPPAGAGQPAGAAQPGPAPQGGGGNALGALRRPAVLAGALTLALSGAVGALLQLLVPLQLHAAGAGAQAIGFTLSAAAVVYIVVSAAAVHLGPRITNRRSNAWMAALMAVGLLPAVLAGGSAWVVATLMVVVVPRAVTGTVAYSLATGDREEGGPGTGAILGLLNTLWAVATVVAPVAAGALETAFDARIAYLAALVVVAAVAAWLVREARAGQSSPSPESSPRRPARPDPGAPDPSAGVGTDWPSVALHPPADRHPTGEWPVLAP